MPDEEIKAEFDIVYKNITYMISHLWEDGYTKFALQLLDARESYLNACEKAYGIKISHE